MTAPSPSSLVYSYLQSPAFSEGYDAANFLAFLVLTSNVGFFEAFVVDLIFHLVVASLFVGGEILENRPLHLTAGIVIDYGNRIIRVRGKWVPLLVGGVLLGATGRMVNDAYATKVGADIKRMDVDIKRIDADGQRDAANAQRDAARMELEKSRLDADRAKRWW